MTTTAPIYLPYTLELRAPAILATARAGYIGGRVIRGALAARLRTRGVAEDAEDFQALVRSDSVRYLNAYPEVLAARGLPWPVPWPAEGPSAGRFIAAAPPAEGPVYAEPRRRRHAPRRRAGRPSPGDDGTFESLQPDQRFLGFIALWRPGPTRLERLRELLAEPLLLGRSRCAGYGGDARIELGAVTEAEYPDIAGRMSAGPAPGERFRALLTSAYIGRRPETGQIDPAALGAELCRRLDGAATVTGCSWDFEDIGGLSHGGGPARPRALAVAAGAVLALEATRSLDLETLRAIEHEGLGEERRDGHGRLIFLGPEAADDAARRCRPVAVAHTALADDDHPRDDPELTFLAERLVLAAARVELQRHARSDLAARARRRPDARLLADLGRLVEAVRDEGSAAEALRALADACPEPLETCRLAHGSLREWLRKVATSPGPPPRLHALTRQAYLTRPEAADAVLQAHARRLRVHLIQSLLAALAGAPVEAGDARADA